MSNAQGIRAGRAFVELFADDSRLIAGLKAAQERLKRFGASVRQAGTLVGLSGVGMFSPFIAALRVFQDAAKRGLLAGADLQKAMRLGESINATKESMRGLGVTIGAALAPQLASVADLAKSVVDKLKALAADSPTATKSLFLLAGGVTALGAALVGLGISASIASFGIGGFLTALKWFGSIAAVWKAGAVVIAAAQKAVVAAVLTYSLGGISGLATGLLSLLNPIALVSAAAAGIGYAILRSTDSGSAFLRTLGDSFGELKDDASAAWGGIVDSVLSGDLGNAASIAWAEIESVFLRGWQFIQEMGWGFGAGIMKGFTYLAQGVAKAWTAAATFISSTLTRISGWIEELQGGAAAIISAGAEGAGLVDSGTTDQVISDAAKRFTEGEERRAKELEAIADEGNRKWDAVGDGARDMRQSITDGLGELLANNREALEEARREIRTLAKGATGAKGVIAPDAGQSMNWDPNEIADLAKMESDRLALLDELTAKRDALMEKISATPIPTPKADVFGSFSAAASFGIGIGSTAADRTAKNTDKMVEELKDINRQLADSQGLVFAP